MKIDGIGRVGLKQAAQAHNKVINGTAAGENLLTSDHIQNLITAYHLARTLGQELEDH